jgi:hypothetical protein
MLRRDKGPLLEIERHNGMIKTLKVGRAFVALAAVVLGALLVFSGAVQAQDAIAFLRVLKPW